MPIQGSPAKCPLFSNLRSLRRGARIFDEIDKIGNLSEAVSPRPRFFLGGVKNAKMQENLNFWCLI
jgi:hypothetical protein